VVAAATFHREFSARMRGYPQVLRGNLWILGRIDAKTLSFFNASRPRSIDFGQYAPMFRS